MAGLSCQTNKSLTKINQSAREKSESSSSAAALVPLVGLWRHPVDSRASPLFYFVFVFTGVALTPSVVYLCITLFTELLNLAGGDVAVLVAVATLVQSQAAADPTLPGSCTMTWPAFNPTARPAALSSSAGPARRRGTTESRFHLRPAALTTQCAFISECHTAWTHTHAAFTRWKK